MRSSVLNSKYPSMKAKINVVIIAILFLTACKTLNFRDVEKTGLRNEYHKSIISAMAPDSSKIFNKLISLDNDNNDLIWKNIAGEDYILMLSWKQNVSYYEPYVGFGFYNTGAYPIWVTSSPELLKRMKTETTEDMELRLKQLLGLPPNSEYSYFVEFWVKPEDMFRPCPDKEINDNKCELCFPAQTDSAHIAWINTNRIDRYYQCELYDKYPWTQLGYTYDWNPLNKSHVGLSEFVIGSNKNIQVKAIYTTAKYLSKNIIE